MASAIHNSSGCLGPLPTVPQFSTMFDWSRNCKLKYLNRRCWTAWSQNCWSKSDKYLLHFGERVQNVWFRVLQIILIQLTSRTALLLLWFVLAELNWSSENESISFSARKFLLKLDEPFWMHMGQIFWSSLPILTFWRQVLQIWPKWQDVIFGCCKNCKIPLIYILVWVISGPQIQLFLDKAQ